MYRIPQVPFTYNERANKGVYEEELTVIPIIPIH